MKIKSDGKTLSYFSESEPKIKARQPSSQFKTESLQFSSSEKKIFNFFDIFQHFPSNQTDQKSRNLSHLCAKLEMAKQ